jgi:hypothetical protein
MGSDIPPRAVTATIDEDPQPTATLLRVLDLRKPVRRKR